MDPLEILCITALSVGTVAALFYGCRKYGKAKPMKQSPSQDNLAAMVEDPITIV